MQDRGYGGYGFLRRRLLGNRVNKEQPLPEVPTARGLGSRPPSGPQALADVLGEEVCVLAHRHDLGDLQLVVGYWEASQ
jgi:hypothetical protein